MAMIGLQLYSIRELMQDDFLGTLARVKEAGFDCVEFAGFGGFEAAVLKKELDKLGLVPYAAHIPMQEFVENLDATIAYAKELGLRYAIIPYSPADTLAACQEVNALLKKVAPRFKEKGIGVGYHNHSNELKQYDGRYALDIIMDGVDGIYEIDTAWIQNADLDNVQFIQERVDRVGPLHAKDINADYKTRDPHDVNVGIGEGIIDFQRIVEVMRAGGALERNLIIEQEAYTVPPFEALAKSVKTLRSYINK